MAEIFVRKDGEKSEHSEVHNKNKNAGKRYLRGISGEFLLKKNREKERAKPREKKGGREKR